MSNNATDELLSYINTILADYAATCELNLSMGKSLSPMI